MHNYTADQSHGQLMMPSEKAKNMKLYMNNEQSNFTQFSNHNQQ